MRDSTDVGSPYPWRRSVPYRLHPVSSPRSGPRAGPHDLSYRLAPTSAKQTVAIAPAISA